MLLRQLDAGRHLRGLARSPLLCAMLCALDLDRRQQLPPDRMPNVEYSAEDVLQHLLDRSGVIRESHRRVLGSE